MFNDVESLLPFTDNFNAIFLKEGLISTTENDDNGASVENAEVTFTGKYDARQLLLLRGVATTMDFTLYPAACMFFGDKIRGAIVGMRL